MGLHIKVYLIITLKTKDNKERQMSLVPCRLFALIEQNNGQPLRAMVERTLYPDEQKTYIRFCVEDTLADTTIDEFILSLPTETLIVFNHTLNAIDYTVYMFPPQYLTLDVVNYCMGLNNTVIIDNALGGEDMLWREVNVIDHPTCSPRNYLKGLVPVETGYLDSIIAWCGIKWSEYKPIANDTFFHNEDFYTLSDQIYFQTSEAEVNALASIEEINDFATLHNLTLTETTLPAMKIEAISILIANHNIES